MDKNQMKKLRARLVDTCKEFGLENVSIAGTSHNEFIGILLIDEDKESFSSMFEAIVNVGRLWQHSRTAARGLLNDFEKVR